MCMKIRRGQIKLTEKDLVKMINDMNIKISDSIGKTNKK